LFEIALCIFQKSVSCAVLLAMRRARPALFVFSQFFSPIAFNNYFHLRYICQGSSSPLGVYLRRLVLALSETSFDGLSVLFERVCAHQDQYRIHSAQRLAFAQPAASDRAQALRELKFPRSTEFVVAFAQNRAQTLSGRNSKIQCISASALCLIINCLHFRTRRLYFNRHTVAIGSRNI
jgi:hypothetical protein